VTDDSRPAVEGPCGPAPADLADAVETATERVLGEGAVLGDGQRDAILAALRTDTLAVLPPAAGKTAIYAITGAVLGGRTVVVSPTLSLHRDQVAHLREAGLTAEALNSELDAGRHDAVLAGFAVGRIEVLVTSPEQLARPDVLARLAAGSPTLFAVDEVHCVSDWGPDFRPDYLALAPAVRALGSPRVLGLTATASVPAREEILDLLGVPEGPVVSESAAAAMAAGARRVLGADVAVALTGVAGPTEQDGMPVGTLCVAVQTPQVSTTRTFRLPGQRDQMRQMSVITALDHLRRQLLPPS